MLNLAFDTCLNKTYIVLRDENIIYSSLKILSDKNNYHSAFLISNIKKVLNENNKKPKDIDLISVNIGPGSFTGIRACTTVARIFAQQTGCNVVGFSSLEIISQYDKGDSIVLLDARKNKVYLYYKKIIGAVYIEEAKQIVKNKTVISDNKMLDIFKPYCKNIISYEEENFDLGIYLSELSFSQYKEKETSWVKLTPLYIQPPPVFK